MSNQPFIGQISTMASRFVPRGWAVCDGSLLQISQNKLLFSMIGNVYGGDGVSTFGLPDLRGRLAIHNGEGFPIGSIGGQEQVTLTVDQLPSHSHVPQAVPAPARLASPAWAGWAFGSDSYTTDPLDALMSQKTVATAGDGEPHDNMMPFLAINFIIAIEGVTPNPDEDAGNEFFVAEVRMAAFNFAPRGWLPANGQLLPIATHQALFAILGTTYGGDGKSNFALPNLQDRTPIHRNQQYSAGHAGGQVQHILTVDELPLHGHGALANVQSPNPSPSIFPQDAVWGVGAKSHYAAPVGSGSPMSDKAISSVGGFVPHQNMQPFQAISFIIRTGSAQPGEA